MKTKVCAKPSQETLELKKVAQELARRNGELPSTLHVLAAVTLRSGAAADLLLERGVTADRLMSSSPRGDLHRDSVERVFARAGEVASLMNESAPTDVHVLVALLGEGELTSRTCGPPPCTLALAGLGAGVLPLDKLRRVFSHKPMQRKSPAFPPALRSLSFRRPGRSGWARIHDWQIATSERRSCRWCLLAGKMK